MENIEINIKSKSFLLLILITLILILIVIRMMKDCVQKFSSLQSQREKTKETFTKDFEQLHLRRSDLDRQFDSIQIKYKERMADFSARKTQAVEEHIEKCAAAAAATAGNNSSSLDKVEPPPSSSSLAF